jgi:hypothetical protein
MALAPSGVGTGGLQALNLFNIVQPQVVQQQINQQQGSAIQQLRTDLQSTRTELNGDEEGGLAGTARPTVGYLTQRKYFAQPLNHSLLNAPGTPGR